VIEVRDLKVTFGGVAPIDGLTATFPTGSCGLLGPNGAGKTTFFNVLSGFVRPVAGSVSAFGADLLAMSDYARARWGLRRSFQQEQAIEELTVWDNVAMVLEHAGGNRGGRKEQVSDALRFVSLDGLEREAVGMLGARERRLVEIARAVVGEPRVVLLDEPAAGLPERETEHLARVIRRISTDREALVILVDHDIDLVASCCSHTVVMDFGKLVAMGPTGEVLRDERVIRAYLGDKELAA
jgi:branched-chain amino acid transport system ATP-binding protein